jgi:hypothetical protein
MGLGLDAVFFRARDINSQGFGRYYASVGAEF